MNENREEIKTENSSTVAWRTLRLNGGDIEEKEDEIAAESGGTVRSRMVGGVRVLSGTGVQYGGRPAENVQHAATIEFYRPPDNPNVTGPMPEVYDTGRPNPFLTPDVR